MRGKGNLVGGMEKNHFPVSVTLLKMTIGSLFLF